MKKSTMKKKLRGFTVSAMACGVALLAPTPVFALTVGEPLLHSRLGQPLDAWIPVLLESPQEKESLDSFAASLAPAEIYLERALEAPTTTVGPLRLEVQTVNGQPRLHLTSQQPFTEPILTLLIKVRLGQVSIVRELTLLPDLQGSGTAPEPVMVAEAPLPGAPALPGPPAATEATVAVRDKPRSQVQQKMVDAPTAISAAAPVALRRFQLDERFSSYQLLAAAGQAPQPVASQAAAVEAQPAEPAATQARVEEQPSTPQRPSDFSNSVLWALALAFGLTLAIRNARAKRMLAEWFSGIKTPPLASTPAPAVQPLPARPSLKASKASEFNARSDELVPETDTLSALTKKPKSVAAAAGGISAERQRLQQLQKQFSSDEAQQKLKLAEAFLDLDRLSSAISLMNEVERLKQTVADRRLALVKR